MNAPRLYMPDLPPLQWRGKRCVSRAADIVRAMAWLRTRGGALEDPHGDASRLRTHLWIELQRRMTEERE